MAKLREERDSLTQQNACSQSRARWTVLGFAANNRVHGTEVAMEIAGWGAAVSGWLGDLQDPLLLQGGTLRKQ